MSRSGRGPFFVCAVRLPVACAMMTEAASCGAHQTGPCALWPVAMPAVICFLKMTGFRFPYGHNSFRFPYICGEYISIKWPQVPSHLSLNKCTSPSPGGSASSTLIQFCFILLCGGSHYWKSLPVYSNPLLDADRVLADSKKWSGIGRLGTPPVPHR